MKNIIAILKKRDNVVSIITIAISIIICLMRYFSSWIDDGILLASILLILSLFVVNTIVEKEFRAKNELNQYSFISSEISKITKPQFYSLNEIPPLKIYLKGASELFYVGGHLNAITLNNFNLFKEWLDNGKTLKFILQNPNNLGLKHLNMPCTGYEYKTYKKQIELSIGRLRKLKARDKGKIEVRVTDLSPTQSISILDGHLGGIELCMLLHLPDGDGQTAPFVRIKKEDDLKWFNLFYERYYKLMWNNSIPII